jgi:hypothetical protein
MQRLIIKTLNENENLTYEHQSLSYQNQELVREIQNNKRSFENQSRAMQEHIASLFKVSEQQQQNVDTLSERILGLANQKQSLEEFVYKFRNTNKKYLKIKSVAEEHVNKLLTQTEQDKKALLLSIALQSVILALRESPDRYNIIFSNNNNYNNNNNEYEEGILAIAQTFFKNLLNQSVNQTMATLEAETEGSESTEAEAETEGTHPEDEAQEAAATEETTAEEGTDTKKDTENNKKEEDSRA